MTDDAEDATATGDASDSDASQERTAERGKEEVAGEEIEKEEVAVEEETERIADQATETEETEETEPAGEATTETAEEATEDESAPDSPADRPAAESSADDPAPAAEGTEPATAEPAAAEPTDDEPAAEESAVPEDVRKYERFQKMDGAQYDRVNEFLRERTHITAREWAIARLCSDFRTETGVEMTKIGENLPELVSFMTDTYTPQAVNQARSSFEEKVRKAGATFLYGAMCNFFTAEELDDVMYEVTEVAKFLLEVEGVDLTVDEELEAEDRISSVMQDVRESSEQLRHDELECPHCGEEIHAADD